MLDGSSIVSILGLGAIGLGFLLAFLTYRLLRQERTNNTPVYVFQFFCFALVLVGASLQYFGTSGEKVKELQAELNATKNNLPASQAELQTMKNNLDATQQKLLNSNQAMARIVNMVPESIKDLEAVNVVLTGNYCEGGSSGKPIWGGRGTEAAARSTRVISNLAAVKSSIEGILPPK